MRFLDCRRDHRRGSWNAVLAIVLALALGGCRPGTPFTADVLIDVENDAGAKELKIFRLYKAGAGVLEWNTKPVTSYSEDWKRLDADPIWPWSEKMRKAWARIFSADGAHLEMRSITGEDLGGKSGVAECYTLRTGENGTAAGSETGPRRHKCRVVAARHSTVVLDVDVKRDDPPRKYEYEWRVVDGNGHGKAFDCNRESVIRSATACMLTVSGNTLINLKIRATE